MDLKTEDKIDLLLLAVLALFVLWPTVAYMIQAFSCPELPQTELLLLIPRSILGDWVDCP